MLLGVRYYRQVMMIIYHPELLGMTLEVMEKENPHIHKGIMRARAAFLERYGWSEHPKGCEHCKWLKDFQWGSLRQDDRWEDQEQCL
jgi:hypothetical protein